MSLGLGKCLEFALISIGFTKFKRDTERKRQGQTDRERKEEKLRFLKFWNLSWTPDFEELREREREREEKEWWWDIRRKRSHWRLDQKKRPWRDKNWKRIGTLAFDFFNAEVSPPVRVPYGKLKFIFLTLRCLPCPIFVALNFLFSIRVPAYVLYKITELLDNSKTTDIHINWMPTGTSLS